MMTLLVMEAQIIVHILNLSKWYVTVQCRPLDFHNVHWNMFVLFKQEDKSNEKMLWCWFYKATSSYLRGSYGIFINLTWVPSKNLTKVYFLVLFVTTSSNVELCHKSSETSQFLLYKLGWAWRGVPRILWDSRKMLPALHYGALLVELNSERSVLPIQTTHIPGKKRSVKVEHLQSS